MFYTLSKLLDLLFSPVFWALAFGLAALLCGRRVPQLARALGALALLTLYLPASGLCARLLFAYVERFDGPVVQPGVHYDAVVLLGGFIRRPEGSTELELAEGGDRLIRAWEMVRDGRADRVLVSGGSGNESAPEADLGAQMLRELGVDPARILRERKSRNTRENAVEVAAMVRDAGLERLALVTSAFHMQRALGCFRAVGLSVDALATDHQLPVVHGPFEALAPRASALAQSELALRELAGRLVYRLRGYAR